MTAPCPYSVRRLFPFAPTTNALIRTKSGAKRADQGFSDTLSAFYLPCSASEQRPFRAGILLAVRQYSLGDRVAMVLVLIGFLGGWLLQTYRAIYWEQMSWAGIF